MFIRLLDRARAFLLGLGRLFLGHLADDLALAPAVGDFVVLADNRRLLKNAPAVFHDPAFADKPDRRTYWRRQSPLHRPDRRDLSPASRDWRT